MLQIYAASIGIQPAADFSHGVCKSSDVKISRLSVFFGGDNVFRQFVGERLLVPRARVVR